MNNSRIINQAVTFNLRKILLLKIMKQTQKPNRKQKNLIKKETANIWKKQKIHKFYGKRIQLDI